MFKHLEPETVEQGRQISFTWNGHPMTGHDGDSVASALLAAGVHATRRHPETNEQRAPYCMMGVCFECLVEIDGIPNRQACQVRLLDGMDVRLQQGARS